MTVTTATVTAIATAEILGHVGQWLFPINFIAWILLNLFQRHGQWTQGRMYEVGCICPCSNGGPAHTCVDKDDSERWSMYVYRLALYAV